MGQQHFSPGQSAATERREAPPWILQSAKSSPRNGQNKMRPLSMDGWCAPSGLQGNLPCVGCRPRATLRFALGFDVDAPFGANRNGATGVILLLLFHWNERQMHFIAVEKQVTKPGNGFPLCDGFVDIALLTL